MNAVAMKKKNKITLRFSLRVFALLTFLIASMMIVILIVITLQNGYTRIIKIKNGIFIGKIESLWYCSYDGDNAVSGFLEGIVDQAAWDDDELIVHIKKCSSKDPSGWYLVDLRTKKTKGPLDDFSQKIMTMGGSKVTVFYLVDNVPTGFEIRKCCSKDMAVELFRTR